MISNQSLPIPARLCAAAFAIVLLTAQMAPPLRPPEKLQEKEKITVAGEDMFAIGFDKLAAFDYTIVDAATGASAEEIEIARKRDQVPDWVRFYDQKRVALTGFMLPLQVENGLTKKLIIMRDISTCCFGNVPNMNEYVIVTMKDAGVKAVQDVPVVMTGIFKIEEKYENGYIVSLFQLDGEKFIGPKK